jgi:cell division protein FtsN
LKTSHWVDAEMKKGFKRKKLVNNKQQRVAWLSKRHIVLVAMIMIFSAVAVTYHYIHNPFSLEPSSWVQVVTKLTKQDKQPAQKQVSAKGKTSHKIEAEPSIHFEFYSTLPSMRVPLPQVANQVERAAPTPLPAKLPARKSFSEPVLAKQVEPNFSKPAHEKVKTQLSSLPIFDANRLQLALQEEFSQEQYILQLGLYKTKASARKYYDSLLKSGFAVKIIKIKIANQDYFRVQLGPFNSQGQAARMQAKLNRNNVNSMLRKL